MNQEIEERLREYMDGVDEEVKYQLYKDVELNKGDKVDKFIAENIEKVFEMFKSLYCRCEHFELNLVLSYFTMFIKYHTLVMLFNDLVDKQSEFIEAVIKKGGSLNQ